MTDRERLVRVYQDSRVDRTCTAARCRQAIAFYETYPGHKRMPINADAVPVESETATDPVSSRVVVAFPASSSHFATCPAVQAFRK